jgi:hypothetical protein
VRRLSTFVLSLVGFTALVAVAPGASQITQSNWTIVSATGTTHFAVKGTVGSGAAAWTFDADILARWRQTAKNAKLPGWHTVSFNVRTMAPYAPGRAGAQRNPIRDIAATATGRASSTDAYGSGSCQISGPVPKGFYSGSAANELFLDSRKKGADLVTYVEGQAPYQAAVTQACGAVHLPIVYDVKRERVKRLGLSLVQKTKKGTTVSLVLLRTVPIVEQGQTVGTVTEKAKITLRLESAL